MAKELLTARKVRASNRPGIYKDGGGLRLIVTAKGTKRWELWISIDRKKRERGIGVFPDVRPHQALNMRPPAPETLLRSGP
jgi:hypothetical protein